MKYEFGLSNEVIDRIRKIFRTHPNIEKAIIYGSRAKNQYREGSDIDLTLFGNISFHELGDLTDELDDLMLVYTFDLSVYEMLKNENLKEHINRVGKIFYQKEEAG